MDSFKTTSILFFLSTLFSSGTFQRNSYPQVPCPDIFQYAYNENLGGFYGRIVVPKDGSANYELQVNMTLKTNSPIRNNIKIEVLSTRDDIFYGNSITYGVRFPLRDLLPKLTYVQFNGRPICWGNADPLQPGYIQTSMWAKSIITTFTEPVQTQPPTNSVENPFFFNFDSQSPSNSFDGVANPFIPGVREQDTGRPVTSRPVTPSRDPIRPIVSTNPVGRPVVQQIPNNTIRPPVRPITTAPSKPADVCGTTIDGVNLLIGGDDVAPGDFPWLVAILHLQKSDYRFHCTGNLLSDRHVLTAGHCVRYYNSPLYTNEELVVVMGKTNIANWANGGMLKNPKTTIAHPNYKQNSADYDVALIVLNERVQFRATVRPICLWKGKEELDDVVGKMGTVVGWNKRDHSDMSTVAQKIEMPIVSQETCLRSNKVFKKYTSPRTFCAGNRDKVTGPCIGDSGAGFMLQNDNDRRWYLRGLVGYSIRDPDEQDSVLCDLSNYAVFMDVAKIRTWIHEEMERNP